MKITRDIITTNEWCCDTMRDYVSENCILANFNPDEPTMVINMRSVAWPNVDGSEMIHFCPFCGERLEVEA
jgi:hypothetical protein